MPRPRNRDKRRAQVVAGLLQVMAERGYERASVNAIAKAAGLAPGLVHYHFKNKQEILLTLTEQLNQGLEARYQRKLQAAGDDPKQGLTAWIDAALARGADADPEAVKAWVFIGAEALRQPEVQAIYAAATKRRLEQLTALVTAVLEQERRSAAAAGRLAAVILSAVEGAYQLSSAAPAVMPEGFAAPSVREAVARLIEAQPRT